VKFNAKLFKKPSFIIGGIVLFFIVLWMINRGSSANAAATGSTGPSENLQLAQLQAATSLQAGQIAAGVQIAGINADYAKSQDANSVALAVAQLQAGYQNNALAVQKALGEETIAAQVHNMDLNYQQSVNANNFALAYAAQAYNYSLTTNQQNIAFQENITAQNIGYNEFNTTADIIAHFGNPARREALLPELGQIIEGQPINVNTNTNVGGGGINLGVIGTIVSPVVSAIA
jgi:hypothetical protein